MKEKTNTMKRVNMDERTLSLVMIALNAAILGPVLHGRLKQAGVLK